MRQKESNTFQGQILPKLNWVLSSVLLLKNVFETFADEMVKAAENFLFLSDCFKYVKCDKPGGYFEFDRWSSYLELV